MIWLTLRRFRFEVMTLALALAALAVWLIITGLQRYATFDAPHFGSESVAACAQRIQQAQPDTACYSIIMTFLDQSHWNGPLLGELPTSLITLVPALVGAMLGAPLIAREMERGTFRLAWTQSRTRGAWLRGGILAQTLVALAVVAAITLVVMWWSAPVDEIAGRLSHAFDIEGIAPLAYTLFALALGIAAGAVIRSSAAAVCATIAGYFVVRYPALGWARARYMPPVTSTYDSFTGPPASGPGMRDWWLSDGFLDRAGRPISQDVINAACGANDPTSAGNPTSACVHAHGWLYTVVWQPDSRFWAFQGIESAIFLALAAALLALAVWWVRRRLA